MSHFKERNEKNCLNCGTHVTGRYCQDCGQENVVVKESFWHLIIHLIEDITHFDGKLWVTLKYLLFKPAFLTKQYMIGKRATYLHPIKMYVFISAVFFLFAFSGNHNNSVLIDEENTQAANHSSVKKSPAIDSVEKTDDQFIINLGIDSLKYDSIEAYDTMQLKLPAAQQDNWLTKTINKKIIGIKQKYNGNNNNIIKAIAEQFQHQFSKILYLSLPLFAFFLWLLYKRNKNIYFVDHLIFSIHTYCAFFIILFTRSIIENAGQLIFKYTIPYVNFITFLLLCFYLYKSLRNQFFQSRLKTIVKFILLNFLSILLMAFLMTGLIVFSVFNI